MKVTLIDRMGDDLTVVNAARVSFDKSSHWIHEKRMVREFDVAHGYEDVEVLTGRKFLSDKDTKLIRYLAKHGHWSPFAHPQVQLHVKAPIFVARQLAKHQVGGVWNEVSRRYVDSDPEFYEPRQWRKKAENVKQGSSEELVTKLKHEEGREDLWGPFDNDWHPTLPTSAINQMCLDHYKWMLESGVCPEQARMILPQSMYTEWYWTGSLLFFARVCTLRLDNHAQRETQEVAKQIASLIEPLYPVSWKELTLAEIQSDDRHLDAANAAAVPQADAAAVPR